eukprot:TRINITY_DN517_c12_g1_i1.p1 TRINITY_DN517_c12_g1~~TRINITY_DN517_c12_g1_i1.p1  ORF type:complete len:142 (+),score=17.63 TRINITY_DN517_c12_g1_i1:161-586(+)
MCLGSIVPENRVLDVQEVQIVECVKVGEVQQVPEEEKCGEVGSDGVRRFKHRRVLCKGAEVLVNGWLAFVEAVDMDNEKVVIRYPSAISTEAVALTEVRSILTNPVNRDLQLTIANVYSSVTSFASELRRCITSCPIISPY